MVFKKKLKILFFINGSSPTPDNDLAAMELDGTICFRNGQFAGLPDQCIEDCDGVAGDYIPKAYAKRFPIAEEVVAKNKAALLALRTKTGDELPPKVDDKDDNKEEEKKEQADADKAAEEAKQKAAAAFFASSAANQSKPTWGGEKK